MMRRSLHRIVPTLLALGFLPTAAWSAVGGAPSPVERDAQFEAVQTLIEREFRLPAQRQLADFQKAGYPDAVWQGKFLAWFYADRFRHSQTLDQAEVAKLAAEAKSLEAELKSAVADKKLPASLAEQISGSGVVIRLVNDLLRVVGQDQARDRLGALALVAERRAALNATTLSLIAATKEAFTASLDAIKARATIEEGLWGLDDTSEAYKKIAQESVEIRLGAVRTTYFAFKILREVAERGQDFGLDPAPAQAFLKDFITAHFDLLSAWDYQWGEYHPYLRALSTDLLAQAARFKIKGANPEDIATDLRKILELDLAAYSDRVSEEIRTLQAKAWGNLLAWYREMGRDVGPKWFQGGLDAFREFKEKAKEGPHFKLDHPDRERAAEIARVYFQAARLQAAKNDPIAAATCGVVAASRKNPLAGNAAAWSAAINGGGGGAPVPNASSWGAQPVPEDPANAVLTGNAMLRQASASGDPAHQRSSLITAAVALRNGVLGLSSAAYAEGADGAAPEVWFRYAESLNKLGMRWHAALVAQSGLRHLSTRSAALKGKTPWKDKDGKWTPAGKFISPLAKNAVTYASNLLVAGKGGAITQLYADTITLVNEVSPQDGGKALDRIEIVIALGNKDWKAALERIDSYVKKYPEEFYDGASMRSVVYMSWLGVLKTPAERKPLAERALKEAAEVADKAKAELETAKEPGRKRILNQAMRDGQALLAVIALGEGKEDEVIKMLGPDYWKSAPSDEDKAAQMLGYMCQALRQWYGAQVKEPANRTDAKLLIASWPRVQAAYEIWKTQKARLASQEERVTRQGVQIAWVFQTIAMVQLPAMRAQPNAPAQLADIASLANRAFADLIEPTLSATSKPDTILGIGNVLWELDEHARACRLFELYLARVVADPELATLRDKPKEAIAPIDGPIRGRPELRAKWEEVVDLLYDDPDLTRKIIEQDLAEENWREKKRDYIRAIETIRALRADVAKVKITLGPAFQLIDDGLAKLDNQVAQLGREISITTKLALGFREQGDKAKANSLYEKLIAYDPTNPDYLAATVELTIDALKAGEPITDETVKNTRIKAARVRDAAQNGTPTYWTAVIQLLELSLYMKDVALVNKGLKFDAVNQSTPADDLQLRPRNQRDDKRVRRARNALAVDLCKRYLAIFSQPGVTAKPSFAITEVAIDGRPTPLFVPTDAPHFAAVRRELDDGSVLFFLWEEGKDPPPEPEVITAPAPPAAAPVPPAAAPAPAAPAPKPEAKP